MITSPQPFDFSNFKKIWRTDIIHSDINEISALIEHNLLLKETLFLQGIACGVLDIKTMSYACIIGDTEKIIGWTTEALLNGGVEFFASKLPSSDYWGFEKMMEFVNKYIITQSDDQAKKFRAILDTNLFRPDGTLSRFCQELLVLKRDEAGNILFLLVVGSDITNFKKVGNIQHFYMTNGEEKFLYKLNTTTYQIQTIEFLSKRELEVVKLMGQNFTSEEIGQKLYISSHTVNTHRRNILEKFNMDDTLELVNFLRVFRFI